jgi:hypothetical protein
MKFVKEPAGGHTESRHGRFPFWSCRMPRKCSSWGEGTPISGSRRDLCAALARSLSDLGIRQTPWAKPPKNRARPASHRRSSLTVGLLLEELRNPPDPFHVGQQELGFHPSDSPLSRIFRRRRLKAKPRPILGRNMVFGLTDPLPTMGHDLITIAIDSVIVMENRS